MILRTGALDNTGGLLQAAGDLAVDTHGAALLNSGTGESGGILAGGDLAVVSGDLDNRGGLIHAQDDLAVHAGRFDNRNAGLTGSGGHSLLRVDTLDNSGGTLHAGLGLDAWVKGILTNNGGLISAGELLKLSAAAVLNRDTGAANPATPLGLQGGQVEITTGQLDNSAGLIAADERIALTGTAANSSLNNSQGTVSSAGSLLIETGAITNTGGTLLAATDNRITANSLTGDGRVLSQGDLGLTLKSDFNNSGEVTANGQARIETSGQLTNSGSLRAGDLDVHASAITNTATGEISGGRTRLTTPGTLTNRGLIDGQQTWINAGTLNNIGTGRIYGDHIAIAAGNLTNREETVGGVISTATIAARERLDLGVSGTLLNREEALIFSAGSGSRALNIGGALDANGWAIGRAGNVENRSATIESLGGLSLSATTLLNVNDHLQTARCGPSGLPPSPTSSQRVITTNTTSAISAGRAGAVLVITAGRTIPISANPACWASRRSLAYAKSSVWLRMTTAAPSCRARSTRRMIRPGRISRWQHLIRSRSRRAGRITRCPSRNPRCNRVPKVPSP